MLTASRSGDGRPLTLTDVAEFIAALATAGVPATNVALFNVVWTPDDEDGGSPAVSVTAIVTDEQAAALPDHVEITELDDAAEQGFAELLGEV